MATSTIMNRNSLDFPDYSNKLETYSRGGTNPFTIPQDGWLIGDFNNAAAGGNAIYVTVNDVMVAVIGSGTPAGQGAAAVCAPVKSGDTVYIRIVGSATYNFGLYGLRK
jgi:hypothetical protein